MTVLGILRDLIDYMCISKADRDPHFGRSSPIFGQHSPLFYPRLLHTEWVRVQDMAVARHSASKNQKEPWRMEGTVKERGWLSSSQRRMPEIN
jgi:hypothetical protein